jgi:hypothetical protein
MSASENEEKFDWGTCSRSCKPKTKYIIVKWLLNIEGAAEQPLADYRSFSIEKVS